MANTIKVNTAAFREQSASLKGALDDFDSYTRRFSSQSEGYLSGFNSDFNDAFLRILKNLGESTGPKLLASIKGYQQKVQALADTFETTDDECAQNLAGK